MSTKNIGQVSGVHIGSTPPVNIIMIWYDNTPSQMVHKVYDVNLSQWVVLDKNTISTITYSELVNLATSVGLSVGAWFKISDRSNALALAVTTTKVQYSDSLGNVLIDDLGTNIQYHVTSSNLSIDDVVGVFDNVNKKLVFQFNEQVPDYTADDFILGKVKRNNIWSLAKYKLSSFLSKVTGNSISWNGGFFFNFNNAVSNILDKTGGVVSKDTYDEGMKNVSTAINNVGQENQTIIQNANQAITNATLPTAIYEKALPSDLEVGGAATNISKGDTLYTLISKIQRWINSFKYATGIKLSEGFSVYNRKSPISNNDTVESSISKLKKYVDLHETSDNIKVTGGEFPTFDETPEDVTGDDNVMEAISKLFYLVKNIDTDQLKKSIIGFDEISKSGVLPTDLFRVELTSSFDFTGGGIGGVIVQGQGNYYFANDDVYPYSPYRLRVYYNSAFPKILSFIPVVPVIPNITNHYVNASSFVHYRSGHATAQLIFQIPKSTYDTLYGQGHRYFKCVFTADIYNYNTDELISYLPLNYVNILNVSMSETVLKQGNQQHIIAKLSISPSETGG